MLCGGGGAGGNASVVKPVDRDIEEEEGSNPGRKEIGRDREDRFEEVEEDRYSS